MLLSQILLNHIVYLCSHQDLLSAYKQLELFWVYTGDKRNTESKEKQQSVSLIKMAYQKSGYSSVSSMGLRSCYRPAAQQN